MSRTYLHFPLVTLAALALVACPKKSTEPAAPIVGWHQEAEGWAFACYFPPNFGAMDELARKTARSDAFDAILGQWRGKREDGISFEEGMLDELETTLLGDMNKVELVMGKNLEFCKAASQGGSKDAWGSWLSNLSDQLTAGECFTHFDYTMYDYLEIDSGWQRSMPICKDDRVVISGTPKDKFRVTDKGEWITVAGNPNESTSGTDLPCNIEGCFRGMLILKFVSEAGVEMVYPVGESFSFTAPEHGSISYRINDDTFYDNTWYQSGGIIDHASVEITPAQ